MAGKILIGFGILLMLASVLMAVGGIFGSFQAMEVNESAGIGAVGMGILVSIIGILALPAGAIFIIMADLKYISTLRKNNDLHFLNSPPYEGVVARQRRGGSC